MMFMYMHAYVFIYMYMYTCIFIYMYIYACMSPYIYMYVQIYAPPLGAAVSRVLERPLPPLFFFSGFHSLSRWSSGDPSEEEEE